MFVNISSGSRSSTPSSDRISCKTLLSNETADSGFFSPVAGSAKMNKDPTLLSSGMLQISPLKMPLSPAKTKNESIMSEMTDISISEEWEKDFFSNFEENLFNMDIDDRILSDILKSPKGKAAMNEMIRSPKGKAFVDKIMKSPKGKMMRHQLDNCGSTDFFQHASPNSFDSKKLSATPMKPELQGMLKMSNSKRRLTMTDTNDKSKKFDTENDIDEFLQQSIMKKAQEDYIPIQPKENVMPVVWPSKERLKFARAQFQKTLEMAIQKASENKHKKKVKFQDEAKTNTEKYPEIKEALSRPAGQFKTVKRPFPKIKPLKIEPKNLYIPFMENIENNVSLSHSYTTYDDDEEEDDSDEDETWRGDLPFTASQKRGKNSSFQNKRRKYSRSKY